MQNPSIAFRIFDWSGHNAVGDDLLGAITRLTIQGTARERGLEARFAPQVKPRVNILGGGTVLGQGFDFSKLYARFQLERRPYLVFCSGARKSGTPLKGWEGRILQGFCHGALQIGVRGGLSRDWLLEQGVQAEVSVIGDAALAFQPRPLPDLGGRDFKVGVSLRSMGGGMLKERQGSTNRRNVRLFARICDAIAREYQARLYFFDLCENRFDSDRTAIQGVLAAMRDRRAAEAAVVYPFQDNQDPLLAFSRLGQMDFVFSQRLHPSLVAWVLGVPSVGLEYQFDKTLDAFEALGLSEWVLDIATLQPQAYLGKMADLLSQVDEVMPVCQEKIRLLKARQRAFLYRLFDRLCAETP